MAHSAGAYERQSIEQLALHNYQINLAELAGIVGVGNLAACHIGDKVTAVSYAEYRDVDAENRAVKFRRVGLVNAVGTAREDDALIASFGDFVNSNIFIRNNLRVNVLFAHSVSNRKIELSSKVKNQYFFHRITSFLKKYKFIIAPR